MSSNSRAQPASGATGPTNTANNSRSSTRKRSAPAATTSRSGDGSIPPPPPKRIRQSRRKGVASGPAHVADPVAGVNPTAAMAIPGPAAAAVAQYVNPIPATVIEGQPNMSTGPTEYGNNNYDNNYNNESNPGFWPSAQAQWEASQMAGNQLQAVQSGHAHVNPYLPAGFPCTMAPGSLNRLGYGVNQGSLIPASTFIEHPHAGPIDDHDNNNGYQNPLDRYLGPDTFQGQAHDPSGSQMQLQPGALAMGQINYQRGHSQREEIFLPQDLVEIDLDAFKRTEVEKIVKPLNFHTLWNLHVRKAYATTMESLGQRPYAGPTNTCPNTRPQNADPLNADSPNASPEASRSGLASSARTPNKRDKGKQRAVDVPENVLPVPQEKLKILAYELSYEYLELKLVSLDWKTRQGVSAGILDWDFDIFDLVYEITSKIFAAMVDMFNIRHRCLSSWDVDSGEIMSRRQRIENNLAVYEELFNVKREERKYIQVTTLQEQSKTNTVQQFVKIYMNRADLLILGALHCAIEFCLARSWADILSVDFKASRTHSPSAAAGLEEVQDPEPSEAQQDFNTLIRLYQTSKSYVQELCQIDRIPQTMTAPGKKISANNTNVSYARKKAETQRLIKEELRNEGLPPISGAVNMSAPLGATQSRFRFKYANPGAHLPSRAPSETVRNRPVTRSTTRQFQQNTQLADVPSVAEPTTRKRAPRKATGRRGTCTDTAAVPDPRSPAAPHLPPPQPANFMAPDIDNWPRDPPSQNSGFVPVNSTNPLGPVGYSSGQEPWRPIYTDPGAYYPGQAGPANLSSDPRGYSAGAPALAPLPSPSNAEGNANWERESGGSRRNFRNQEQYGQQQRGQSSRRMAPQPEEVIPSLQFPRANQEQSTTIPRPDGYPEHTTHQDNDYEIFGEELGDFLRTLASKNGPTDFI